MQIDLKGWTHVHTWHESHGNHSDAIYQREQDTSRSWDRRIELVCITTYHKADRPTGIRTDHDHDYLMARDIRANPTRYARDGARSIEPCCTAGSDDFIDTETDQRWRIFGAAGHGEWAFKLGDKD